MKITKELNRHLNTLGAIPVWTSNVLQQLDSILKEFNTIAFLEKDARKIRLGKAIEVISSFKNPSTNIIRESLLNNLKMLLNYDSENFINYETITESVYELDLQNISHIRFEITNLYESLKKYEREMHSLYLVIKKQIVS